MVTLQIHSYDWEIRDLYGDDEQTVILSWGLNRHSIPYLLRINTFPVFCYIELPVFVKNKFFRWDKYLANELIAHINSFLRKDKILKTDFVQAKKIYYYQGSRTFPFIRTYFKNIKAMRTCQYVLNNAINTKWGWLKCNVLETQISIVRKLLTLKNVRFSGWFEVQGIKVQEEDKISVLDNEYIVDWTTMRPLDVDWITYPGVLSWDIECYSDNHLAMPDKYNDAHVAYMISAIYKKYKEDASIKRYGIVIGDCNNIPSNKLDNCVLIHVTDEVGLVDEFGKIIMETDPEILIGYNILGFDYPYLDHRIKRQIKEWPKMSRLIGEVPIMDTKAWKSKAYGINVMNTLKISGRISIDLLPIVKRDYKLDTYTLNNVCLHFIQKEKHDVKAIDMFIYFEDMLKAVYNYKEEQNDLTQSALEKAKKQMTKVMRYCIQDSELVLELMESLDTWIGLIELSNIVGVTMVEIFTKGQQLRCLSQLYDLASRKNYVITQRDVVDLQFCGGSVKDPIPGLYNNIICLDFKSLYPSIIQAFNICFTTLVHPDHEKEVKDCECHVIEFDQEEDVIKKVKNKVDEDSLESEESNDEKDAETDMIEDQEKEIKTKQMKHYKFRFYKNKEGLIPLLVKNLVAERNGVRRKQRDEKNPQMWMVLEKRQLALKVSANSFFGFLGVREGGKLPCMEAAMSITAKGRELIAQVATYLHDKYNAKIVYGDSVSGDTPILCRLNNQIFYNTIHMLPCYDYVGEDKEYGLPIEGLEVWSDVGFTKINKIIRHKTTKQMYRIFTPTGVVDVTEDHSLLDIYKEKIKPIDVSLGTILLHHDLPIITNFFNCLYNNSKDKLTLANTYLLLNQFGYFVSIDTDMNFTLHHNKIVNDNVVYKIIKLPPCEDYVYDLETDNHHFAAGIGRLVVHNTDSVMVDLKIIDSKECTYWGELLSQEISGVKKGQLFPGYPRDEKGKPLSHALRHEKDIPGLFFSPLEMEFEKAMKLFCLKKKKYAAFLIEDDGTFIKKTIKNTKGEVIKVLDENELLKRGIVLARRDNNLFLRHLYEQILNIVMNEGHFKDAMCLLIDTINDLVSNKIDYKQLKSTRELGAHYKQPSFFMKVFSDELKKKGKMVNPGDRLEFVVIENKEANLVGQKMVLVSDYAESLTTDTPYKIDYLHYIEKVLINPIDQLISIGFKDYIQKLNYIKYKPPRKRNFIYLSSPTEMMFYLVQNNMDINKFKDMLLHQINLVDYPQRVTFVVQ
jgi:DNA polymerase elongation subunit (family B)